MNTCLFSLPIEPLIPGVRYRQLLMHCTAVYWFRIDRIDELRARTKVLVQNFRYIELKSTGRGMFGLNNDVPVATIEHTDELDRLHTELIDLVSDLDGQHTYPEWIGTWYKPHVSDVSGKPFCCERGYPVKQLALVRKGPEPEVCKTVVELFELGR